MGRDCFPEILLRVAMWSKSEPDLEQEKRASVVDAFRRRRSLLRIPFVHGSLMGVERHPCEASRLCNLRLARNSNPGLPAIGQALSMTTPERRYTTCYRLRLRLMFFPAHSPPTSAFLTKFINMASRGGHVVTSHTVFVGRPLGVTPQMPKRIAGARRTGTVFEGRLTRVRGKDISSGKREVCVEFCSSETAQNAVQNIRRI
jgi:hypothetical protein